MGGDGSGRRPSTETVLKNILASGPPHGGGDQLVIPNYSGIKPAALKAGGSTFAEQVGSFTAGSVLFANASNQITQDNANFFWDDSNNRLGIGTTSPGTELHVKSASGYAELRIEAGDATSGGTIEFYNSDGLKADIYADDNSALHFRPGGSTDAITALSSGNVGIGTTSPDRKLLIKAATATEGPLAIQSSDASNFPFYVQVNSNDGNMYLRNAGNVDTVRLNTNGDSYLNGGNVGIGTISPNAKLHLSGAGTVDEKISSSDSHAIMSLIPGSGNAYAYLDLGDASTFGWQIGKDINAGSLGGANGFYIWEATTGQQATRLAINKGGNVGIGTTSPDVNGLSNVIQVSGAYGIISGVGSTAAALNMRDTGATSGKQVVDFTTDNNFSYIRALNDASNAVNYNFLIFDHSNGAVCMANNNGNPTLTLANVSGGMFVSGGALFYKGDQGTITQIAAR